MGLIRFKMCSSCMKSSEVWSRRYSSLRFCYGTYRMIWNSSSIYHSPSGYSMSCPWFCLKFKISSVHADHADHRFWYSRWLTCRCWLKMMLGEEVRLVHSLPLVQSVASLAVAVHQLDLLPMVSLSLGHSDAGTSNPCLSNILLMMHNEHTVLVASFVLQRVWWNLKLVLLLWEQRELL